MLVFRYILGIKYTSVLHATLCYRFLTIDLERNRTFWKRQARRARPSTIQAAIRKNPIASKNGDLEHGAGC